MTREPDSETDRLTQEVIGAAIEVHRLLGPGYLEAIYETALMVELNLRGIRFERQKRMPVNYKGYAIGKGRLDLLVDSRLVVELKAVDAVAPIHTAQVLSYLKASRISVALLINFNVPILKNGIKRIVLSNQNE
jgi:GxxExxY protein